MPVYADPQNGYLIRSVDLARWCASILSAVGTPPDIAADVAEVLIASDRRGIASHGTARLPSYMALVEAGALDPAARPVVETARSAMARFDARNGWGQHAGRVAVDWAIGAAAETGSATAIVAHSNHYGIAGWYALRAVDAGMIGISLSNTSPLVAPTRARQPLIGTNPIAIAAPAGRWGAFCLDMATSTIPRGRIEVAQRRGEELPIGWAIDAGGHPATTPAAALGGALQPLGGDEANSGYKGFGLGLAVDILTGVLSGSAFGPNVIPLFSTHDGPSDLGQTFVVVDPAVLGERGSFERRLEGYLDQLAAAPTVPGASGPVLIPGQPEAVSESLTSVRGVTIDSEHHADLVALAKRFGHGFPDVVPLNAAGTSGDNRGD